jgi:hypothetical protein
MTHCKLLDRAVSESVRNLRRFLQISIDIHADPTPRSR